MARDPLAAALLVGALLERLTLRYAIGGAVASTLLGEPRTTLDVDLLAEIPPAVAPALLDRLEEAGFYVPRTAALEAIASRRSFNIIHRDHALKVDIFVAGRTTT